MHVRIGGVPEHFNLPWLLAIEDGLFSHIDVDVEWIDYAGGTGEIMRALADDEIDMATPLTEGAVTAIANGNPSQLLRVWVDSPLLWGVFVRHDGPLRTLAELPAQTSPPARFAISRFGSGSELMSRVMAQDLGWTLDDDNWVVVGGLDGALHALPAGEADVFLWSKSMTQPYVDNGTFDRIDVVSTPWPSFSIVASETFIATNPGLAESVSELASARAAALMLDDSAAAIVAERYELEVDGVLEWLEQIRFTPSGTPLDHEMIETVEARMRAVGRIP